MPILYIEASTWCGFFLSWPCVPTPNVRLDIWDRVEFYLMHMFLARGLKITFTSNLKLIISILVSHSLLLNYTHNTCVSLRWAKRPSASLTKADHCSANLSLGSTRNAPKILELHYLEGPCNVIADTFSRLSHSYMSSPLVRKKATNVVSDSESNNRNESPYS